MSEATIPVQAAAPPRASGDVVALGLGLAVASAPEPLLPIEKKLIGWSQGLGLALMALLVVMNQFAPLK